MFNELDKIVEKFNCTINKVITCKEKSCNAKEGIGHSEECQKAHDKNTDRLNTAGNRNPEYRHAGYKGHSLLDGATEYQVEAYQQGVNAREG